LFESKYHAFLMDQAAREKAIYLAKLAEQAERYDEMVVHGSLARAGKVKAQTPKVAKQEKPKKPRGRANFFSP